VRIALGAERRDIVLLVAASVFAAVAVGALTGAGLVWWLSRFVTKLLFQVSPHDWIALVATLGLLALTAILGAAIPLRRATKVDPIVALRAE
jgi:putative ABC transport system permease protein